MITYKFEIFEEIVSCTGCPLHHDGGFGDPYCTITRIRNTDVAIIPHSCPLTRVPA